ncbi:MAG: 30S ribosomal protein S9 [Thermoguttaceae bacterium]|mgnify:CR=1 FL=1|jgi:small subunit ribosomal protein S9
MVKRGNYVIEGNGKNDKLGTGRRKSAVARVRVRPGQGRISVNNREFEEFFRTAQLRNTVLTPLVETEMRETVDVVINVYGGGTTGQADACKLGIARALKEYDPECETILRQKNLLTRDARRVERKKYGRRGARRSPQFSKR